MLRRRDGSLFSLLTFIHFLNIIILSKSKALEGWGRPARGGSMEVKISLPKEIPVTKRKIPRLTAE